MSDKQKEILERIGEMMKEMNDKQLENLLYVGEGMAIMSAIKNSHATK